jgi:soluble lytic murein transglycosylase-like protein
MLLMVCDATSAKKTKKIVYDEKYYVALAKKYAKKYEISRWQVLYSLWWWESAGETYPSHWKDGEEGKVVVKGDGKKSIGLGQINLNAYPEYTEKELLDIEKNAEASAKILASHITYFYGLKFPKEKVYNCALAAYNMGRDAVKYGLAEGDSLQNKKYQKFLKNYSSYVSQVLSFAWTTQEKYSK